MLEFLHNVLFCVYVCVCVCVCVYTRTQSLSHVPLFATPWTVAWPGSFVHGIFCKNAEVGCHFLSPGDLPNPGIAPTSLASPAWAGGFFTTEPPGKLCIVL